MGDEDKNIKPRPSTSSKIETPIIARRRDPQPTPPSEKDKLNPKGEHFDPLKALYSKDVAIPVPNAPVLDNIGKCISKLMPRDLRKNENPRPSTSTSGDFEMPARRFLPHQEPVRAVRPKRVEKNILTRMRDLKEGPLALLKDCMERRVRVKVYTRNQYGIRGYCIAFVVAFDKHWNLALEDVTEVWTRNKIGKRKVPALGTDEREAIPELTWDGNPRPRPPRVLVRKTTRRTEECERHVGQLMVRGEQVAIIAVLP